MKIVIKIVGVLAIIIGLMAIITGSWVLLGFFDPGYTYFIALISYNIIMGVASIIAGIYIWRGDKMALMLSAIIMGLHLIVLFSLVTVFNEIISTQSIGAMLFRSVAWLVFLLIIWKGKNIIAVD